MLRKKQQTIKFANNISVNENLEDVQKAPIKTGTE